MSAKPLNTPIATGDVGIVLKPNGDVHVFTTGDYDSDPEKWTDAQIEQGLKLKALALVATQDDLMDKILEIVKTIEDAGGDILENVTVN